MSYGRKLGWEGPIGNYIGFWGPVKGYTTNLDMSYGPNSLKGRDIGD